MGPGYPIICFFAWNLWRASKMCCRYSCQNGHAILAQVLPLRSSISKKFRLPFLAHGCVEPSGKRTGNFAMASVSVIDMETNDGEDYLLIDMPEAEAAPALGCPLSWHKTVLPEVNTCLGFQVNPCGPVVDFPMDKKTTLGELLHKISSGASFTAKELERALGRLNWATAAWPLSRPFLQPFWAWKAATTSSGRPSKLIRSFALILLQLLHHPQVQPCPYDPPQIGGEQVTPVHIPWMVPTSEAGLLIEKTPPRSTLGGSITRYH